jgi:hypothetical protein
MPMKTRTTVALLIFIFLSACNGSASDKVPTETPEPRLPFPFITEVSRYSEVMESSDDTPLLDHFPETIPSEASNVKFAYQPRIMQGAMFLELLMVLPEDQVDDLWTQYSGLEKYQFSEDKTLEDIPEPILFLIRDENHELDRNFVIFFIDAQPAGQDNFPWNHGTMYGVGINKANFEVIYWLQYW